jgi:hypothetical protein
VPPVPAALPDAIYRVYHVTLTQDRWVYSQAGRFEISSGGVALLDDPTGLLAQHLAPGPLTPAKRYFLISLMTGSYREVVREQPGVAYLPSYATALSAPSHRFAPSVRGT